MPGSVSAVDWYRVDSTGQVKKAGQSRRVGWQVSPQLELERPSDLCGLCLVG